MLRHDSDGDRNSMAQVLPRKGAPALNRGGLVKTQTCSGKQMAKFQQKSQKNQYLGSRKLVSPYPDGAYLLSCFSLLFKKSSV